MQRNRMMITTIARTGVAGTMLLASAAAMAGDDGAELQPTWESRWFGTTISPDQGHQVLANGDGTISVIGEAYDFSTSEDVLVLRFDSAGNELWARRVDGPDGAAQTAGSAVVDDSGAVWVPYLDNSIAGARVRVMRVDAAGNDTELFVREIVDGAETFLSQMIPHLGRLGDGVVLCFGSDDDFTVLRLDGSGAVVWEHTWSDPSAGGVIPEGLVTDDTGRAYAVGRIFGGTENGYLTLSYAADGTGMWMHREGGALGAPLSASVSADVPGGGVVVAGSPETTCGTFAIHFWRLAPDGTELVNTVHEELPCQGGTPRALDVDAHGRIAIASTRVFESGMHTYLFDADGVYQWHDAWTNAVSGGDQPFTMSFDHDGGIVTAGSRQRTPSHDGFGVIRYSASGVPTWSWAGEPGLGSAASVVVLDDGRVVTTGRGYSARDGQSVVTLAFDPPPGADVTGDGVVGFDDVISVLAAWGPCSMCLADLDGDGVVGFADLVIVLASWS